MGEDFLLTALRDVGLPGAVCLYTLFGVNKTLQKQDMTLTYLTAAINRLTNDVDKRLDKQEDETRRLKSAVDELRHEVNLLQRSREE